MNPTTVAPQPGTEMAVPSGTGVMETEPPGAPFQARRPRRWARRALWALAAVLVAGGLLAWWAANASRPVPQPVIAGAAATTIRAEVRPAKRATLAAVSAGTVDALYVQVGQTVDSKSPIARVQSAAGVDILTAPWRGTIGAVPVHLGDTVMPGTVIASLADYGRLQIETLDVDEFQVARLHVGQDVLVTVDALDQSVDGRVSVIGLEPQVGPSGDTNYPVTIALVSDPIGLRSGMTARIRLTT